MKKILLSAFSCNPIKGSEPGNGWNWAIGLSKRRYEVHCFTRIIDKLEIERVHKPDNLIFHYITLPFGLERLYSMSTAGMYLYYILWQWLAYINAKRFHKKNAFSLAHHVTWGSIQMGSFMYKLGIPFVFGPAGGGQVAPSTFRRYFTSHWNAEQKREKITRLMLKYNPACKKMLQKAHAVLVSNPDTKRMVQSAGAKNAYLTLDSALADSFFPNTPIVRKPIHEKLKLLWIGRFMPRKGLLLVLDVMKELAEYKGITLTVVGDGEMRNLFLDKVKEFKLESTVHWVGKVTYDEVKIFYKSHDAFFFTSLRDSGPAQLIEAMAYSLPIITIDLHGQAIIVNEQVGTKCDCKCPDFTINLLKEAILSYYYHPDVLIQKGKNAYEFAIKQTWDKKIDTTLKEYYPSSCLN